MEAIEAAGSGVADFSDEPALAAARTIASDQLAALLPVSGLPLFWREPPELADSLEPLLRWASGRSDRHTLPADSDKAVRSGPGGVRIAYSSIRCGASHGV